MRLFYAIAGRVTSGAVLDRDFEKMRAEMDRIEKWLARRADKANLVLIRNKKGKVSLRRLLIMFLGWALLFVALPTWLLGGF